ncbi:helix-turn-helix transcriptional regulator [Agriterribacter sp.]|uniref:helix-turn-helix domain-containing protein n=1 Tax=Agriterribacter sp. TaxID=2821509 RepID=UPI002CA573E6|nr:helix-turn-helix transcriptional regulator [Agriterribacter sp.]HTN05464.1 helix-turn-helix transcriptional regulator [Agriterribacter sp.]
MSAKGKGLEEQLHSIRERGLQLYEVVFQRSSERIVSSKPVQYLKDKEATLNYAGLDYEYVFAESEHHAIGQAQMEWAKAKNEEKKRKGKREHERLKEAMEMGQAISLSTNDNSLGKQIQAIRQDAGLTQKQLAEKVGLLDGSIVRFYESGQSNPSLEILQKKAAACGYRHENVFKKRAIIK